MVATNVNDGIGPHISAAGGLTEPPRSTHLSRENEAADTEAPSGTSTPLSPPELEQQTSKQSIWLHQTLSPIHEIAFVALICCSQFVTQAGFGQVLLQVERIGSSLGATSPGQLSWTVAGYSLTVGTFVLPAGRLGDMYGSKRMVMIGWAWFGMFSVIAGLSVFAPKGQGAVIMFCTFQALRGMGPAILLPNSVAILGRSYPNGQRKNMAFALFAMCAPTGAYTGALFGTILGDLAWWPWALFSIGITAACLAAGAFLVIPADNHEETPVGQRFDFVGAMLGVSGLILFNFGWNQATNVGWQVAYVPTLLAIGVLILAVFVVYEKRVDQPLLPPDVFNAGVVIILAIVSLGWMSFGAFTFYTIQIIEVLRGCNPLNAAAQLTALAIAGTVAAISTGFLIKRIPAPWMMSISAAAFTVGNILTATMPARQTYWAQTFIGFLIIPFGMDISFPASSLILSNMVPRHRQGVAASLVNTVINYSISIGLGAAGTAEREVRLKGASELHGYRVALWVSVGMAGSSLIIALSFALYSQFRGQAVTEKDVEKREALKNAPDSGPAQ